MKSITRLRKLAKRREKGYPVATIIFYGPDDKKASKVVLGIIAFEGAEPQLHKWFQKSPNADFRYDIDLQNTWLEIIRREGVQRVAMIEEINGCPHEEGVDYPVGEVCPECPFWADQQRPIEPPPTLLMAIATYREDQWDRLRASAADRDSMDETWEKWNAGIEEVIANLESQGHAYVCVQLDVEEIEEYCKEQGVPNDSRARSALVSDPESGAKRKRFGVGGAGRHGSAGRRVGGSAFSVQRSFFDLVLRDSTNSPSPMRPTPIRRAKTYRRIGV
jgi:hypothetical protein